jgi:hypothetical protein
VSLRLKIVLALVLLATCATAAVGYSSYVSTRNELNAVIDRSLQDAAKNPTQLLRSFGRDGFPGFGPGRGGSAPGGDGDAPPRVFDSVLAQVIDELTDLFLDFFFRDFPLQAVPDLFQGQQLVIIGGDSYTAHGREYHEQNPHLPPERLVMDFAGQVEKIWTRESLVQRRLLLAGLYVLAMPIFTISLMSIVQAIHCAAGKTTRRKKRAVPPAN